MRIKKLFTVIILLSNFALIHAQSKEILAKSAMLNAEEAYNNENYSECFSYLKEVETTLGKTDSRIQYLKVKALMATSDWKRAEVELKVYFEITPESEAVPEKFDEMVMAVSKIKKSIAEAEKIKYKKIEKWTAAINTDPQNAEAYLNRGAAKDDLNDYQGAIQDYSKAIELDPNNKFMGWSYNNRGHVKKDLKDYQGAIQDYSKALELNPKNTRLYANRGDAKSILHDYNGAIQDYTKAIENFPTESDSYYERGRLLQIQLKNIEAAKPDFEKVISLNNGSALVCYSYFFLGNKEKAFNILKQKINSASDNNTLQGLYYNLACLHSLDNNKAESLKALTRAFELGYNNFSWIESDAEFDNIRNSTEFKELIIKYKK